MGERAPANKRVLIVGGGKKNGADQLVDYSPVLFRPRVCAGFVDMSREWHGGRSRQISFKPVNFRVCITKRILKFFCT